MQGVISAGLCMSDKVVCGYMGSYTPIPVHLGIRTTGNISKPVEGYYQDMLVPFVQVKSDTGSSQGKRGLCSGRCYQDMSLRRMNRGPNTAASTYERRANSAHVSSI